MKMKLIWTEKEVEEFRKGGLFLSGAWWHAPEPFEKIKVKAEHIIEVKEKFQKSVTVSKLNVMFPIGCSGLVEVRFWILKNRFPRRCLLGDNNIVAFDEVIKVRKGTMLRVKIRNRDVYDHFVGVRVDVNNG